MADFPPFEYLMVLPRLRVQNANALSSPMTHGFPSMTAFLGLMWALERKTQAAGLDLQFNAVSVVAHDFDEQTHRSGYISSFRLTRNPMGKDGKPAAIVEEGRIHLELSLVFAVRSDALREPGKAREVAAQVQELVSTMRIAGGTVLPIQPRNRKQAPYVEPFTGDDADNKKRFNRLKMRLLPGFVLVERSDLLDERLAELRKTAPDANRLDAWLSLSRINWTWQPGEDGSGEWQHDRKGWLVPIPLGYGALTEVQAPGSVANARDSTTPFCFVESVYGIGQWLSPHRLQSSEQMFWYPDSQPNEGLYRCRNGYSPELTPEYDYDL
ncbi:type I-F CRISPR-associated protein Csy2 [Marinimicrobium sp. C6131]|uniref:type I-F CRISPR-associated protein Csy2 n=1 Tax=Marinimicrobium TaxID=359337 RepID=UPI00041274E9|nr:MULTISPECIES: type I-F CRISPR-associated protein Csy2 [Marinimicrobium]UZJ45770.1 type I-F CRISPR-associated protein Csy2 [Marinimicrobium sp. C6131]